MVAIDEEKNHQREDVVDLGGDGDLSAVGGIDDVRNAEADLLSGHLPTDLDRREGQSPNEPHAQAEQNLRGKHEDQPNGGAGENGRRTRHQL